MKVISSKLFIDDSDAIITSETLVNPNEGETLVLEVYGDATGMVIQVEGKIDTNNEDTWTQIAWYDVVVNTGTDITSNGIYNISVLCISNIRVKLTAISTGNVSVYGRLGV